MGEVAVHLVELLGGAETVQPEQLLLQGSDDSLDAAIAFGLADEGLARLDTEGLELVLEGVRDEPAAMVVAELRVLCDLVLVASLREVHGLAEALDGLEARAAPRGAHPEAFARAVVDDHEDRGVPLSVRQPVASMAHISSGFLVVIVRSCVSGPRTLVGRSQARMPCWRMILRTRGIEVRTPRACRSRAQILRWPSPTNGVDSSTARISARSCPSERKVLGLRFGGSSAHHPPAPCGAGRWRGRASMSCRRAGCRRASSRRVTSPGSKRWPPRRRAESVLQDLDLLLEELDLHGLVADLGLEVVDEAVAVVGLARLEPGLHAGKRLVTPLGEFAGRDAERSAEGVERLSADEPQDDLGLAAAGPSSLVLAVASVGSARAPRSLHRRRRLVSWLPHGVVHCALESQAGVSGNYAAHQASVDTNDR